VRIALLSDIHANLTALDAVLADMPSVDRIVCCGDLVEYYDQPNEVCARVRERGIECIRGNHDAYVIGALTPSEAHRAAFRTDWTRATLHETHLDWLDSLDSEMRIEADGRLLRLRHASPWDEETYLYPDSHDRFARIELASGEILAVGHTHRPLHVAIGEGWLINPGSVGQPRDWDPRASYAIVDMATAAVEHRRTTYDVAAVQRRLEAQDWDPHIVGILSRSREQP
jgi:predicted phosphodiesterase